MSGDTTEEFMRATYRALCTHGYANLTMQDIADESSKSKAALHYHFDSKRELLSRFQEFLADRFFQRVREADTADAADERLAQVLDAALSPPEREDDLEDLQTALLELKAQAPYEPAIREHGQRFDEEFRGLLRDIFEAGVADGSFRSDLDTEAAAQFVVTALAGAQTRNVFVGQRPETTRELLATYVEDVVRDDESRDGQEAPSE